MLQILLEQFGSLCLLEHVCQGRDVDNHGRSRLAADRLRPQRRAVTDRRSNCRRNSNSRGRKTSI